MKKYIIVTGGAGFVGTNLIQSLLKKSNFKIISLDNYSSGSRKNHIKNKKIIYLNCHTKFISKKLNKYKNNINSVFHFGEFARIYQSFIKMDECIDSNTIGTNEVFKFCMINNIKLIYSATSASFGNRGKDKNLSPYAFTKSKNLEYLENLKKWFRFKYEIVYFYNLYGPFHIRTGPMSTVIGIFENCVLRNKPLTVVKPGSQSRRFTHVKDAAEVCIEAWKKNKCRHYSITHKEEYKIVEVAKLFSKKIKYLPRRPGERYASALTKMNLSNKVYRRFGKIKLKNYIKNFLDQNNA